MDGAPDFLTACWICDILRVAFSAMITFGRDTFTVFTTGMSQLITVVLALWLLVQAGSLLMPFGASERPKEVYNTIIIRSVQVIFFLVLLNNFDVYWEYVFLPVALTAGAIGASVLDVAASLSPTVDLQACVANAVGDDRLYERFECNLIKVQKSLGIGLEISFMIMTRLFNENASLFETVKTLFSAVPSFISGIALMIVYGVALLTMPFRAIDVLFKWLVFTVLSPIIIAAAIFPTTRAFTVNTLKIIFHSGLTWIMSSVVAGLAVVLVSETINIEELRTGRFNVTFIDPVFWQLMAIGILVNIMIGKASDIAAKALAIADNQSLPDFGSNFASGTLVAAAEGMPENILRNIDSYTRERINNSVKNKARDDDNSEDDKKNDAPRDPDRKDKQGTS